MKTIYTTLPVLYPDFVPIYTHRRNSLACPIVHCLTKFGKFNGSAARFSNDAFDFETSTVQPDGPASPFAVK
jgi:hypothetical protein